MEKFRGSGRFVEENISRPTPVLEILYGWILGTRVNST